MNKTKYNAWICIAWKPLPSRDTVCKTLTCAKPITSAAALREFKRELPGHRNYTVQPSTKASKH